MSETNPKRLALARIRTTHRLTGERRDRGVEILVGDEQEGGRSCLPRPRLLREGDNADSLGGQQEFKSQVNSHRIFVNSNHFLNNDPS